MYFFSASIGLDQKNKIVDKEHKHDAGCIYTG